MMYITIKNKKRGFTLVETLFYISGLVVLLVVITSMFIYMYDWYRTVTIAPRVDRVGITLVDKIVRDIHTSESVNSGQSSFGVNNGYVSLTGVVNSASITKDFSISNGRLAYRENGGSLSYLTPSSMTVSRFYLTNLNSPISSAIKFDLDISYMTKQGTTTNTYSAFSILRQSYE